MPTYEYQCEACKKTYDLRESFSAPSQHTCEKCGKGTAKRVLHAPRVVFKGSGWYVTDSRNSSVATDSSSSSSSSSDNGHSSSSSDLSSDSSKDSGSKVESSAAK